MIDMLAQVSDNPADLMAFFDLCAKRSVDVYNGADELPPRSIDIIRTALKRNARGGHDVRPTRPRCLAPE
jgi:hypothetical protein